MPIKFHICPLCKSKSYSKYTRNKKFIIVSEKSLKNKFKGRVKFFKCIPCTNFGIGNFYFTDDKSIIISIKNVNLQFYFSQADKYRVENTLISTYCENMECFKPLAEYHIDNFNSISEISDFIEEQTSTILFG